MSPRIDLTYWMNSLQSWLGPENVFCHAEHHAGKIDESLVWDRVELRHPVYDLAALAAQKRAVELNGRNRTWLCVGLDEERVPRDGLSSGARKWRIALNGGPCWRIVAASNERQGVRRHIPGDETYSQVRAAEG